MSRIGKKPITLPKGVKYTVQSNIVVVEGPKGKVNALIPRRHHVLGEGRRADG